MWKEFDISDTGAVADMEDFVRNHCKSHFMQMPCWSQVKNNWQWRGLCIYRENRLVAAVGLLIRALPLGYSLFYCPRGPVCDRNDSEIWEELMQALKISAKKYRAIELYLDPDEYDTNRTFRQIMQNMGFRETMDEGFGNIQPQNVFRLNLTGKNKEEVFAAFGQKTRYNIGLAQRKGVAVQEFSGADVIPGYILQEFYGLMEITGQRDRFYIRDIAYFERLLSALGNDARLFIARLHGQAVAGSIEVFCGEKAWYLYGASSNEYRNTMPNYLMQWSMIQRAMERGCWLYDFRGVPGNTEKNDPLYGLYRFKKGFSGTYTRFTGLFTYDFRPMLCRALRIGIKLRKCLKPKTRK